MDFGFQIADCGLRIYRMGKVHVAWGKIKMSSPAGFYERLCEPRGAFLRNFRLKAIMA